MLLLDKKELISKILIIMFLITYFIPNFNAIDRIGNQWFYLSIISFLSFIYLLVFDDLFLKIKLILFQRDSFLYLLFILWALISITYSINKAEALVTFNQYLSVFIFYILLKILSQNIPNVKGFFLKTFLFLLIFEVTLSIYPILKDLEKGEIVFRSMTYAGAASNINITAFSLLYKTPILFYFFTESKNLKKVLFSLLLFTILFIVSILGTRGAYLGVVLCFASYTIYIYFLNNNAKFKFKQLSLVFGILIISIISNISLSEKNSNVISRASTITLNTQDGSVNQRLRYYKQGLSHFFENPILGVGIGNWKLVSIDYDKKDINGFIVPYHAHNDLIQLLTELGILGLVSYILFIIFSTKNVFNASLFDNKINYLLLGSLSIYLLDSMLNFPIARPISQIFLVNILCFISLYDKKKYD